MAWTSGLPEYIGVIATARRARWSPTRVPCALWLLRSHRARGARRAHAHERPEENATTHMFTRMWRMDHYTSLWQGKSGVLRSNHQRHKVIWRILLNLEGNMVQIPTERIGSSPPIKRKLMAQAWSERGTNNLTALDSQAGADPPTPQGCETMPAPHGRCNLHCAGHGQFLRGMLRIENHPMCPNRKNILG